MSEVAAADVAASSSRSTGLKYMLLVPALKGTCAAAVAAAAAVVSKVAAAAVSAVAGAAVSKVAAVDGAAIP
jgi:hypothetical protein